MNRNWVFWIRFFTLVQKQRRESIEDFPVTFLYASRSLNGRFAITAATFFFPTPGSHLSADAGSVLILTGTGRAVIERMPQSTTTASVMVFLCR